LPEESNLIASFKSNDNPNNQDCAALYQKGIDLYNKAVKEYDSKNYKKALDLFQQVLEIFPLHKNAYGYIIKTLGAIQKDEDPNRKIEESSLATDARNEQMFQNGLNEYLKQNYSEAAKYWAKLIQISPDYRKAFEYLRKAQGKVDEIAQNFIDQGAYFYQKGDVARAISEWEKGLALCPDNEKLKIQIEAAKNQNKTLLDQVVAEGDQRMKEKKYEEALKIYSAGSEKYPDAKVLKDKYREVSALCDRIVNDKFGQAKTLYGAGKFNEALSLLRAALQINADFAPAKELVKKAEEQLAGDFKRSMLADLFKEAVAALDRGQFMEGLDKLREVEKEEAGYPGLQEKLKIAQNGINAVEARKKTASGFNKGLDLFNGGYYQSALKEWRAILKETPDNDMVKQYIAEAERLSKDGVDRQKVKNQKEADAMKYNQTGLEFFNKKNFSEAYKSFEKAVEADPENPALHKALKNCRKEVIKEQEKLTPETEKKVERLFLDGINFYREGQYKKAIECWKQVVAMKPEHKKAQTYITNVSQKLQKIESI
jgi:tetratricopeptide (TPR) repeat protein